MGRQIPGNPLALPTLHSFTNLCHKSFYHVTKPFKISAKYIKFRDGLVTQRQGVGGGGWLCVVAMERRASDCMGTTIPGNTTRPQVYQLHLDLFLKLQAKVMRPAHQDLAQDRL